MEIAKDQSVQTEIILESEEISTTWDRNDWKKLADVRMKRIAKAHRKRIAKSQRKQLEEARRKQWNASKWDQDACARQMIWNLHMKFPHLANQVQDQRRVFCDKCDTITYLGALGCSEWRDDLEENFSQHFRYSSREVPPRLV